MYRPSCKRFIMLLTTLAIINGLLWSVLQGGFTQGAPMNTLKLQTRSRFNKTRVETTRRPVMSESDKAVAEGYLGKYETAPLFSFTGSQETGDSKHKSVSIPCLKVLYTIKKKRQIPLHILKKSLLKAEFIVPVGPDGMHLALATCGNSLEEVKVLVKSVLLFSRHATFHVFSDTPSQKPLCEHIKSLPGQYRRQFIFHVYNAIFPRGADAGVWENLFRPCAAQRLFMPYIIPNVTKLIYVDTDVILLSQVDNLWGQFSQFNKSHIAALIQEGEDITYNWYNRVAKTPYYGKLGLNSGVMLMDLVRLREDQWLEKMMNYFKKYLPKLLLGDQDLINIFFHFEPEKVYKCSCEWNYRSHHCQYPSTRSRCPPALKDGAHILHGAGQRFHGPKYPALKAVYTAFQSHRLGLDTKTALLENIKTRLKGARSSCGSMPEAFYKQIEEHINSSSAVH